MNGRRYFLGAWIVIVAIAISGCGEQATLPATGTIYGDLLHQDGTPASGVFVLVEEARLSTVSDEQGRFVIDGLVAVDEDGIGKYYTVRGASERDGVDVGFLVERMKVKGQQSYGLGVVTVPPTGAITGNLHLEDAEDHSGIRLEISGISLDAVTRSDGSFRIDRVPAHEGYKILCIMAGYQAQILDQVEVGEEMVPIRVESGETLDLGQTSLQTEP